MNKQKVFLHFSICCKMKEMEKEIAEYEKMNKQKVFLHFSICCKMKEMEKDERNGKRNS